VTATARNHSPSRSRIQNAFRALDIPTVGIRPNTATGPTTCVDLSPPTTPCDLGRLEAIGYDHGAAQTLTEVHTMTELGWVDIDHWVEVELATALRTAARSLTGLAMAVTPAETRELARGAALGRIDTLRAYQTRRHGDLEPDTVATPHRTASSGRPSFHGGC
jgi:hypothetical protein